MKEFALRDLFSLGRGLRNFLAASSTTMELLQLKVLDFGLQRPTGPSSGAVACILLVSLLSNNFYVKKIPISNKGPKLQYTSL